MAMRPRRGGSVFQTPRLSVRPTYETFRPRSVWKHEDDATMLLLYLPGFVKEQIGIDISESNAAIKIQGQRLLAGGRWVIFNQTFSIPSSCDPTKFSTQFEMGILTIIMPRKSSLLTSQDHKDPQVAEPKTTTQQQQLPPTSTTAPHDQEKTSTATQKDALQEDAATSTGTVSSADDTGEESDVIKEKTEAIPDDKLPTKLEKADGKKEAREATHDHDKLPKLLEKADGEKEAIADHDKLSKSLEKIDEKKEANADHDKLPKSLEKIDEKKEAMAGHDKQPKSLEKIDEKKEAMADHDKQPKLLEKADGKKKYREGIHDEEKLPEFEKDHKGDGEEKFKDIDGKSRNIKDKSVVEKETKKSEGQELLNVVIAALVLMGLGAHIFSKIAS